MQGSSAERRKRSGGATAKGQAWRHLVEGTTELIQRLDAELLVRAGLDIQTYDVLLHLSESEGGLRMTDLAVAVVLSKSGLTALVDRLERDGLIARQADARDRRVIRVDLTSEGVARFEGAVVHHRAIVHDIFFAAVTVPEARVISAALSRARSALRADAAGGGPPAR